MAQKKKVEQDQPTALDQVKKGIAKAADLTALKVKLSQARSKKKDAYTRLGELCYSKHRPRTDDVTADIEKAISTTVAEITELSQIIIELELRIKLLKAEK